MFKITRIAKGGCIIFQLSGRLEDECSLQLEKLMSAERYPVILDLREVTIVGLAGVRFLARSEEAGTRIQNCPAYIREWIRQERRAQ